MHQIVENLADQSLQVSLNLSHHRSNYDNWAIATLENPQSVSALNACINQYHPDYSFKFELLADQAELRGSAGQTTILVHQAGQVAGSYQGLPNKDLLPGDLILIGESDSVKFSSAGAASFLRLDICQQSQLFSQAPGITLLSELPNLLGGCNPGSDSFNVTTDFRRELNTAQSGPSPLDVFTVLMHHGRAKPHYHPIEADDSPAPGGQHELYFFHDSKSRGLDFINEGGANVIIWPDGSSSEEWFSLRPSPGDLVYIPPGVGHLAQGLVSIFAFPGRGTVAPVIGIGKTA